MTRSYCLPVIAALVLSAGALQAQIRVGSNNQPGVRPTPSVRPSTPARPTPSVRPSRPVRTTPSRPPTPSRTTPSRPSYRPQGVPGSSVTPRPSVTPSRPVVTPTRPSVRPSRPAAPSRPSYSPGRTSVTPARPSVVPSRNTTPSRPSTQPARTTSTSPGVGTTPSRPTWSRPSSGSGWSSTDRVPDPAPRADSPRRSETPSSGSTWTQPGNYRHTGWNRGSDRTPTLGATVEPGSRSAAEPARGSGSGADPARSNAGWSSARSRIFTAPASPARGAPAGGKTSVANSSKAANPAPGIRPVKDVAPKALAPSAKSAGAPGAARATGQGASGLARSSAKGAGELGARRRDVASSLYYEGRAAPLAVAAGGSSAVPYSNALPYSYLYDPLPYYGGTPGGYGCYPTWYGYPPWYPCGYYPGFWNGWFGLSWYTSGWRFGFGFGTWYNPGWWDCYPYPVYRSYAYYPYSYYSTIVYYPSYAPVYHSTYVVVDYVDSCDPYVEYVDDVPVSVAAPVRPVPDPFLTPFTDAFPEGLSPAETLARGEVWMKEGDYRMAAEAFRRAWVARPGDYYAPLQLGLALFALEDWDLAGYAVSEGLDRNPEWIARPHDAPARFPSLAAFEGAVKTLQREVVREPDDAHTRFLLGYVALVSSRDFAAYAEFSRLKAGGWDHPHLEALLSEASRRLFGSEGG